MLPKFDGIEVICNQWKESRQFEWRFVQVFKPHLWRQLQEMQLIIYIGETGMKLHERLNQHRHSIVRIRRGELIDKSNDTGLSEHFALTGHCFEDDAALYILEKG